MTQDNRIAGGQSDRSRTLRFTSAAAVNAFLPSTGTVAQLPNTITTDPGATYGNSLASELVALKLSIRFDDLYAFSTSSVSVRTDGGRMSTVLSVCPLPSAICPLISSQPA